MTRQVGFGGLACGILRMVEPAGCRAVRLAGQVVFDVAQWPDLTVGPTDRVALRLPLPVTAGTPYVRNGWQSWSAPVRSRLGAVPALPPRAPGLAPRHPFPDMPVAGDASYDVLAADGFVAGVLEGGALFLPRPGTGDLLVVREGPGPHPDVWSATGDAPLPLLLDACRGRSTPRAVPLKAALRGWSSWSAYGPAVTPDHVEQVVRATDGMPAMDVVSIDDGWQAVVGDWDRTSAAFTGRLADCSRRIRGAGLQAGIWCAPFIVAAGSRVARDRPEWLLRGASGEPVVAMRLPAWGGLVYALDVTRPDMLAWAGDTLARLVALGYDYLKLDFLYAAALAGAAANPAPADTRMRQALNSLRTSVGPDTFLVGCGCPLWPAIGLVDAMRVGPDVSDTLRPPAGHPDPAMAPCLDNAWRSSLLRAPMHRRLWVNDPDAVQLAVVADPDYRQARTASARRAATHGEMLFWSDPLDSLDADALALWREVAGTHHAAARGPHLLQVRQRQRTDVADDAQVRAEP